MYAGSQNGMAGNYMNKPQQDGDEKLMVMFYPEAILNPAKSLQEGREIYDEIPFITIRSPGDSTSWVERKATDADKLRFKRQWEAYTLKDAACTSGTPLEQWPILGRARIAELKALGIRSVEDLANVSDGNMQNLGMGIRDLRTKAQDFIAAAKSTAPLLQMREELESLKQLIKQKDEAIGALKSESAKDKPTENHKKKVQKGEV